MFNFSEYMQAVSTLRPDVAAHLPSLEWLVSGRPEDRRTGRTTALALAFVRSSCGSSRPVQAFDHQVENRQAGIDSLRSALMSCAPGVLMRSDGSIMPGEAYPSSPSRPDYGKLVYSISSEFSACCRAALAHGVSVEWMMSDVRMVLAESVIRS